MSHSPATADIKQPRTLIWSFLAPAVILFAIFFIAPLVRIVQFSFITSVDPQTQIATYGIANYTRLVQDDLFWLSLWHNMQFVFIAGVATLVLGIALAWGLTQCGRGRGFFRTVFLFPNVMAAVATAILWSFIFNPSFGLVNGFLRGVGLEEYARAWLGEPGTALPTVMFIFVWSSVGFYVVLFYAGLLRIPDDYREAATIDGATAWQEFRHISLPLLTDILKTATIYMIINAVNVFALIYLINESRLVRYNTVLLTYMYTIYKRGEIHYACTLGVAGLIVVMFAAAAAALLMRRDTVEM